MRKHSSEARSAEVPGVALLLADHLDSALAAAEDLEATARAWPKADANFEVHERRAAERRIIERIRAFEAVLIGRVLRARKYAQELARDEAMFASLARLFAGGTAALADAVTDLADASASDFETGDCLVAYLRRRGVIDAEACDLPEHRELAIDENFLVAGRIALGPMTEMIIAFLDALEREYDLYPEDEAAEHSDAEAAAGLSAATNADAGSQPPESIDNLKQRLEQLNAKFAASGLRLN